jgi:hypothetical protein
LPVGEVTVLRQGKTEKDISITLAGFKNGLPEEVLIVIEGVHAPIPSAAAPPQAIRLMPPPPFDPADGAPVQPLQTGPVSTDADRVKESYRKLAAQQGHTYGDRAGGAPNYNVPLKQETKPRP